MRSYFRTIWYCWFATRLSFIMWACPWKRRQKELEDELREMKLEIGRLYDSTAACADLRQKIISLKEQLAEVKYQLAAAHDTSAKWMLECDAQRQSVDNAALRIKKLKQEVEDSLQQEDYTSVKFPVDIPKIYLSEAEPFPPGFAISMDGVETEIILRTERDELQAIVDAAVYFCTAYTKNGINEWYKAKRHLQALCASRIK